ncbi:hypothetical protein NECAME_08974 [Necator americanus]|uniref:Uncharacterized protein n=1 Tax=Necator americanus TaxID=51031 RepID=W2TFX6_NECAM|nr:hypothetical protein NECAME_08974 [Necator americanus]ETN80733.1 hypothetical protein NECAME_08974 [Necator americanus]
MTCEIILPLVNVSKLIDELAELVQAGMFVPLVGPNGRPNGRTPPYTLPLTHLPMMHMTARRSVR